MKNEIKQLVLGAVVIASIFNMGMAKPQQQPTDITAVTEAADAEVVPLPANVATEVEAAKETGIIPQDAVRLRIIANSDSDADQLLKRQVRDEIIDAVALEVRGIDNPDDARTVIEAGVPKFNEIAKQVLADKGSDYAVTTDFGLVPFPTKLYGNKVYPAGDYEALRIRIGEAKGQNWWCVLFPPLCFVDKTNGDAVPKMMDEKKPAPITTVSVKNEQGEDEEVQVRSALFDKLSSLWDSVTSFFA
ncbi:MAG TPA: stage II sporulation protein R [Bacilli bacterium]|nr:stage II sporulation protein R [Bacilli bacterium]